MSRRSLRPLHVLLGLVALAAFLRFWRIGHQSFWLDEAFTAWIVPQDFAGMLEGVHDHESTPPLYYTLAWAWERVFGADEAGLRSLSAVFGTATIPVAYAAARELFTERAALIAAALFAVNPYFVWYSQEARSYALLVLLSTVALLGFARTHRKGVRPPESPPLKGSDPLSRARLDLWLWAVASALAILTHYFAVLLVAPMAAWLLWRERSRALVLAAALPAAVAVALLPLAIAQRDAGHTLFISNIPFGERLVSLPKKLATGELGTPTPVVGLLVGAALVAGAALALRAARREAALLLGLAAANVAIALVLKAAGLDYFLPRNLIAALVPVLIVVAAGFAAVRAGPLIAGAVTLAGIAFVIQVSVNPSVQRADWRGAARALGPATVTRAIVVTPEVGKTALRLYAGPLPAMGPNGARVAEVALVANAPRPRFRLPAPPPGFRLLSSRTSETWQVVRYVASSPLPLGPHRLGQTRLALGQEAIVLLQPATTLGAP